MNAAQIHYYYYSGSSQWSPTDWGSSLVAFLDNSNYAMMYQEQALSNNPNTPVSADAQSVGYIQDSGYHGRFFRAESDTRRPVIGSDATRNSYLTFDGTDDYILYYNSKKYLKKLWADATVFSMGFWVKMGSSTDGVLQYIFDSGLNTSANFSFSVTRNTSNQIFVNAYKGVGGQNRYQKASTATVLESTGWTSVLIEVNGTGASAGRIKVGSAAWETFTVNAGADGDGTYELHIGTKADNKAAYGKFSLDAFFMLNRTLTDEDVTNYLAYNPSRNDTERLRLQIDLDFDQDSKLWADSGKTVPATNGSVLRVAENNVTSIFGPLNNDWTTSSDTVSPLWREDDLNSLSVAEWDGSDDNASIDFTPEKCAKWLAFIVVKNDDDTLGSHPIAGAAGYVAITGQSYVGNTLNGGNPYGIMHGNSGDAVGPVNLKNQANGWNVYAFGRDGSTLYMWGTGGSSATSTNTNVTQYTVMGTPVNAGWNMDGKIARLIKYRGFPTGDLDAYANAQIAALESTYAI